MDLQTTKIVVMILLGGISTCLGFIPMYVGKWFRNKDGTQKHGTIFSCLLCFGGGVLLATCLLHMLPEIRENFEHAEILHHPHDELALAEIIMMIGFFFIYFIEEFVFAVCKPGAGAHGHSHTNEVANEQQERERKRSVGVQRAFSVSNNSPSLNRNKDEEEQNTTPDQIEKAQSPAETRVDQSHKEDSSKLSSGRNAALRDFFTVLALSFHAIFEGLAIGLEEHEEDVWILYAAVAAHKYVISFCVGLELYNVGTPKLLYAAYTVTYAMMSVIGIGIGIGVTSAIEDNEKAYMTTVGVLSAMAAGTLLYVAVFEILEREKSKVKVPGLVQLVFVILGFCAIMLVEILAPHHHHDEEEEGDETTLRILNNLNNSTVVQVIKDNGVNGVHNIITDLQNFCGAHCV